jgi:hypothetical protein
MMIDIHSDERRAQRWLTGTMGFAGCSVLFMAALSYVL